MGHKVSKIEVLAPFLVFTGVAEDENNGYSLAVSMQSVLDGSKTERTSML